MSARIIELTTTVEDENRLLRNRCHWLQGELNIQLDRREDELKKRIFDIIEFSILGLLVGFALGFSVSAQAQEPPKTGKFSEAVTFAEGDINRCIMRNDGAVFRIKWTQTGPTELTERKLWERCISEAGWVSTPAVQNQMKTAPVGADADWLFPVSCRCQHE